MSEEIVSSREWYIKGCNVGYDEGYVKALREVRELIQELDTKIINLLDKYKK